jgi:Tfp pilus assembly protein PilV
MSLIELMIAMTMLVVGLIGVLALITTAISGNNRNKMDTSATMLAQMVLETIAAQPANLGTTVNITDCNPGTPNTWGIATATANPPGNGPAVDASSGGIDWTVGYSTIATGYKMRYVTCGANGQNVTYDVRWNIQTVNNFSKMITVSARALGARTYSGTMLRFFSPPVTVRTIVSTK